MSQFAVYRVKDQTKAPWQLSYFEVLEQKKSYQGTRLPTDLS